VIEPLLLGSSIWRWATILFRENDTDEMQERYLDMDDMFILPQPRSKEARKTLQAAMVRYGMYRTSISRPTSAPSSKRMMTLPIVRPYLHQQQLSH